MKVIYKYEIDMNGYTYVDLPTGSIVVDFATQGHTCQIWVEHNTLNPIVKRTFIVFGTGQEIPENHFYVSSLHSGGFVWHLYERIL